MSVRTLLCVALSGLALAACKTQRYSIENDPDRFLITSGTLAPPPTFELDERGGKVVAVVVLPNPGWDARLEGTRRSGIVQDVIITAVRPNPDEMHPQVLAQKTFRTDLTASRTTLVYARVLDFDDPGVDRAFRGAPIRRQPDGTR
ncbi:MAG: hypothetical protein AAGD00_09345 [Planctomycetota bacterium]